MIDVVFQLLIFFICTASFQQVEETLPMGLATNDGPDAATETQTQPNEERIVVSATRVDGQTRWTVNDRLASSLRDLQDALRAAADLNRAAPVTLDVAGAVPLGDMIDVYDLCRITGLEKIEFAVTAN
jgi:biopolymer transport protein ExbD